MPPADGADALAAQIERHEHGPICSVHLWFDREITDLTTPCCSTARFTGCTTRAACSRGANRGAVTSNWSSAPRASSPRSAVKRRSAWPCANWRNFSRRGRSEARKSCIGQGSPRNFRCSARNRRSAPGIRLAVAELHAGRRLDRNRLALHDGKRRAQRTPRRRSSLRSARRAAEILQSRSQAPRPDAAAGATRLITDDFNSVRQQVHSYAHQHRRRPPAPIDILFQKNLARDGVRDQSE